MRLVVIPMGLLLACGDASIAVNPVPDPADTGAAVAPDAGPIDAQPEAEPEDTTPRPPLEYPPGPYGLKATQVFPNLVLQGYRSATGDWVEMKMLDYYDPDGSRGITGIHLDGEAQWCPPSNTLGDAMPRWNSAGYGARGARLITTLIEGVETDPVTHVHLPATQSTIDRWIAKHHTNFDIMADPLATSLPKTGSVGLPYRYTIDPRTMKIVRVTQGIDPGMSPCTTDADCCKTADSPDVCSQDYFCSPSWKTCLTPAMRGPIGDLDGLMIKNGASPFPTGL